MSHSALPGIGDRINLPMSTVILKPQGTRERQAAQGASADPCNNVADMAKVWRQRGV